MAVAQGVQEVNVAGAMLGLLPPEGIVPLPKTRFLHGLSCTFEEARDIVQKHSKGRWWTKHSLVLLCCDKSCFHYFVAVITGPRAGMRKAYHYMNDHGMPVDSGSCVETNMDSLEFCVVRAFVVSAIAMDEFETKAREFMARFEGAGPYVIFVNNCRTFAQQFLEQIVGVPAESVLAAFKAARAFIGTALQDVLGTLADFWRGVYHCLIHASGGEKDPKAPYGHRIKWRPSNRQATPMGVPVVDVSHGAQRTARRDTELMEWHEAESEWHASAFRFNECMDVRERAVHGKARLPAGAALWQSALAALAAYK